MPCTVLLCYVMCVVVMFDVTCACVWYGTFVVRCVSSCFVWCGFDSICVGVLSCYVLIGVVWFCLVL